MISQEQLSDFINGDDNAISASLIEELPKLVFFAYSFVEDMEVARDITSDLFERLFRFSIDERNVKLNNNPDYFKNLIYFIIKNKCLDYLKTRKNRKRILNEHSNGMISISRNEAEDIFTMEAFSKVMIKLGNRQREILELKIKGYKPTEIADQLSISVNTVLNTINVSKKKVALIWEDFFNN